MFSGLDLSLLPLIFSLILTVASRLLNPYSTEDKTSRLMVKIFFHSEGHPERFTELHREEKEEGDRGDQKEKRVGQEKSNRSSQ